MNTVGEGNNGMDPTENTKGNAVNTKTNTPLNSYVAATQKYSRKGQMDFPGGAVVKNPPANAGDMGSSPGPRRFHMLRSN